MAGCGGCKYEVYEVYEALTLTLTEEWSMTEAMKCCSKFRAESLCEKIRIMGEISNMEVEFGLRYQVWQKHSGQREVYCLG